jgi:hypothetical protein
VTPPLARSASIAATNTIPTDLLEQLKAWLVQQQVPEQSAYTIKQIRYRNGDMNEATWYALQKAGRCPVTMVLGNTLLVTAEEERNWQRRMSRPTGSEAARQKSDREKMRQRALRAGQASAASDKHISKQRLAAKAAAE